VLSVIFRGILCEKSVCVKVSYWSVRGSRRSVVDIHLVAMLCASLFKLDLQSGLQLV
jgi:hypothetical protein